MKRYIIQVTGKVQGVFYRATTQKQANLLNIKGWVRNEADGSVLIDAEGDATTLAQFIGWCKQGPQRARVSQVSVTEEPVVGYQDFTIQR